MMLERAVTVGGEELRMRIHGGADRPLLVYLPGLHGDWTLIPSYRKALEGQVRFVEFTYPRSRKWHLKEYGEAIELALKNEGMTHGWILGESFGSQVTWALLERGWFQPDGIILAGGFVKYPIMPMVRMAKILNRITPWSAWRVLAWAYAKYAAFRYRNAPENLATLGEFLIRRTQDDLSAAAFRLDLILESDPRHVAASVRCPVHFLAGFWDIIVPCRLSQGWLKQHVPTYKGSETVFGSDHTVLANAPAESAQKTRRWMNLQPV